MNCVDNGDDDDDSMSYFIRLVVLYSCAINLKDSLEVTMHKLSYQKWKYRKTQTSCSILFWILILYIL